MITYIDSILILFFLIALANTANNSRLHRKRIKESANREYNEEIELSLDELESRLNQSELMYEDLEQTYWVHVSTLIGICSYLYWHSWYISIAIGVGLIFLGVKYLAIRPFTTGVPDTTDEASE